MIIAAYLTMGLYLLALSIVLIYCLMQFHLLYHYRRGQKTTAPLATLTEDDLPFITVQLPIFNELYVVERLIDNIAELDYPKHLYEIHVLDDSTDETVEVTRKKVEEYAAKGYNIRQITRVDRQGYKAGALKDAMPYAKGEFIAIFDADFLPHRDFLRRTLPYFRDSKVGVVQTRWEHINENYSLLTRLQAFQLNVHFTVEQKGRQNGTYLLQFNGTAGVWRRATIDSAGGWEADTLTEDLDLSYRAQLKGWKILFREEIGSPAELPAEMHGLKSQQFRWMKGGAETARKMLPTVWSADISLMQKLHATVHLLGSSVFLSVFALGVLSVPVLFLINPLQIETAWLGIFLISLLTIIIVYYIANVEQEWKTEPKLWLIVKFILIFPIFLSLSMGLSLHNSVAVLQGYLGKKSAFIRTPKFDITELKGTWKNKKYRKYKLSGITIMEGLMALYFVGGIAAAFYTGEMTFLILHILLTFGYGATFFYSVKHLNT